MPVIKNDKIEMPGWCELQSYELVALSPNEAHIFKRTHPNEKLIIGKGKCQIRFENQVVLGENGTNLNLIQEDSYFEITEVMQETIVIRMCGDWPGETSSGIFTVSKSDAPQDGGDPVDYPKETNFDSHYHDCDEYWILFEGSGTAVTEGQSCQVEYGDCVATGMGHHHDFPQATEPVRAVYFETLLEGRKRSGHLWNHTHGKAQPDLKRV